MIKRDKIEAVRNSSPVKGRVLNNSEDVTKQ